MGVARRGASDAAAPSVQPKGRQNERKNEYFLKKLFTVPKKF
jgi:hypothetical protein